MRQRCYRFIYWRGTRQRMKDLGERLTPCFSSLFFFIHCAAGYCTSDVVRRDDVDLYALRHIQGMVRILLC